MSKGLKLTKSKKGQDILKQKKPMALPTAMDITVRPDNLTLMRDFRLTFEYKSLLAYAPDGMTVVP
jgi:hypothetical protein